MAHALTDHDVCLDAGHCWHYDPKHRDDVCCRCDVAWPCDRAVKESARVRADYDADEAS